RTQPLASNSPPGGCQADSEDSNWRIGVVARFGMRRLIAAMNRRTPKWDTGAGRLAGTNQHWSTQTGRRTTRSRPLGLGEGGLALSVKEPQVRAVFRDSEAGTLDCHIPVAHRVDIGEQELGPFFTHQQSRHLRVAEGGRHVTQEDGRLLLA